MKSIQQFGREMKAVIQNPKIGIPIMVVLLVPVLYAGMFLWAFWDPYDRMDQLPVAVVNLDEGAEFEGERLTIGDDLVQELQDNPELDWQFVDEDTALEGLRTQEYYMMVRIPRDFSEKATTVMDDTPQKLELDYVPNESFNFLAAQIGETAMKEIKTKIAHSVSESYAQAIFDLIEKFSEGMDAASDGAGELADGTKKAKDGSDKLNQHLQTLAASTITFREGAYEALSGSEQLTAGMQALNDGVAQLASGLSEKEPEIGHLASGAAELEQGLQSFADAFPALKEGMKKLISGAGQAQEASQQVHSGLAQSLAGMKEMEQQLPQLSGGAAQLAEHTHQLANGVYAWRNGASEAAEGAAAIEQGIEQIHKAIQASSLSGAEKEGLLKELSTLKAASHHVSAGVNELSSSANEIQRNMSTVAGKMTEVSQGQQALQDGFHELVVAQGQLSDGAGQLSKGLQPLADGLTSLDSKLDEAADGVQQLGEGSHQIARGTHDVHRGWQTLIGNVDELHHGVQRLLSGSEDLSVGLSRLADGTDQLVDGTGQLSEGSKELNEGLDAISEGTHMLAEKLDDGAEKARDAQASDETNEMVANPVELHTEEMAEVPNYGTGFAPYFLSLGLYVGALMMSIVYPMRKPAAKPRSGFSWFLSKFGFLAIVGVIQALIAVAVMLWGLKIQVESVPYFIMFSIITSLVFITLIQMLVTTMDNPGRFIAIVLLILQLTTSAGTFPLELIPESLQVLNAWLPMTYTVAGYKAVISSGDLSFMWHQVAILITYIAVFMLGTLAYFVWKFREVHKVNHPDHQVALDN